MQTNNTMKPEYIIPDWPAPQNIKAYTTTRRGGYSESPYDRFNLGPHVGENPETLQKNIELLTSTLHLPETPTWLNQVHGIAVADLNDQSCGLTADACVTSTPNKVCAILTADCLPILVCNQAGSEVAAIHGGWRGLLAGVIDTTIKSMHSAPSQLMAWMGPAISQKCFEVNEEIRDQFLQSNPQYISAFSAQEKHIFADLYHIARINLMQLGVTAIYGGNFCTYTQHELFYSYRRDQRNTGRMASLIWTSTPS